jgi:predicted rRNA pseudouridine synthase
MLGTKTAHCGTLDPPVSGVLPMLVGKGIKLLEWMQQHDKEYVCLMWCERAVDEKELAKVLQQFVGKIFQRPPLHAAVAKNVRVRKIYAIDLFEVKGNYSLFRVECQHGTYVRKLVEDVGLLLGTKTRMEELRRTRTGPFLEKECVELTRIKDAAELAKEGKPGPLGKILLPLEEAVRDWPKIAIKSTAVAAVSNGADIMAPGVEGADGYIDKGDVVAIMCGKRLIGVGKALFEKKQLLAQKKGPVVDLKKVVV